MEITAVGRRLVESREFALRLRKIAARHQKQIPGNAGLSMFVGLICWAATGHDIARPPRSQAERRELAEFARKHTAQLNKLADKCLENLVKHDTGGKVH